MLSRDMKRNHIENLRSRIFELLDENPSKESQELLDLLREYWEEMQTDFDTKMAPWKAPRIYDIRWKPPILQFRIERHPGDWERIQRWSYDFDRNEAKPLSEWAPQQNPPYTKKQAHRDAQEIVEALVQGRPHTCIESKGQPHWIWMGRLPQTKWVRSVLPWQTAKGRQRRLKEEVAKLMETHTQFQRVRKEGTTGSIVYARKGT